MCFTCRYPFLMFFFSCFSEKRRSSMCVGCGSPITDQYILRVSPDLEWHAACLKCADCHQFLDETCTCYVREGKTYCKRDYFRWERKIHEEKKIVVWKNVPPICCHTSVVPLAHVINYGNNNLWRWCIYCCCFLSKRSLYSMFFLNWSAWNQSGPS